MDPTFTNSYRYCCCVDRCVLKRNEMKEKIRKPVYFVRVNERKGKERRKDIGKQVEKKDNNNFECFVS